MIHLNDRRYNTHVSRISATLLTLAIVMTASIMVSPLALATTATTSSVAQPVTATTDNQSVNVLISWEPMEIKPGQDAQFTLNFQDPSTGESIRHVNYNLEIKDQNGGGRTVQSMTDLHSHSGTDEQTVTFDAAGSYNLVATIIGTGIDPPFDTTKSGTAQTVISVGQQEAGTTTTTATTGNVAIGAKSACDPTQATETGGIGGSQNTTGNNTTTMGGSDASNTATVNATTTTNTTTAEGAGSQTTTITSSPTQLIEQACSAALNNDTQGVMTNLNLALSALDGNRTTTEGSVEGESSEGNM